MKIIIAISCSFLFWNLVGCGHSFRESSSKETDSSKKPVRVDNNDISVRDSNTRTQRGFFLNGDIESIDIYCWCLKLKNNRNDSLGIVSTQCSTVIDVTYAEMMKEKFHKQHLGTAIEIADFYNQFKSIDSLQPSKEINAVNARILFLIKYKNQMSDTIARSASGNFVMNSYYKFQLPDFESRIRKVVPTIDNLCTE